MGQGQRDVWGGPLPHLSICREHRQGTARAGTIHHKGEGGGGGGVVERFVTWTAQSGQQAGWKRGNDFMGLCMDAQLDSIWWDAVVPQAPQRCA
jgi:hypothetical protein